MATKKPGIGSTYLASYTDKNGRRLDGSNSYKLHVPANPPAEQFRSIAVYSWDTRTLIDNKQGRSGHSSRQDLIIHDDGSVDLYYGPTPREGKKNTWVQTIPGRIVTSQHLVQNHAKIGSRVIGRWLPRHTHNWHRSIFKMRTDFNTITAQNEMPSE